MKKLLSLLLVAAAISAHAQSVISVSPSGGTTSVPTQAQLTSFYSTNTAAIATKEPSIATGTPLQYWSGIKAWATFPTQLSAFTNNLTGITASQMVLTDINKTGTVTVGSWNATPVADAYVASATTWNAKEPAITAGVASQYWTGSKSWATLPTYTPTTIEYTATAAQTSFVLPSAPVGDITFSRNGMSIGKTYFSVTGTTVTYSGETIVAADLISIRELHN